MFSVTILLTCILIAYSYNRSCVFIGFQNLQLPKECLEVTFSDDDSIKLLISRPSGQGIYIYALVAHLIYTHNEFVIKCSELDAGGASDIIWKRTQNR